MTLARAHRIAMLVCTSFGAAVLLVAAHGSGPLAWQAAALPAATALGQATAGRPRWQSHLAFALGILLLALALGPIALTSGVNLLDGAAVATALLSIRLALARLPSHDGQSLLLLAALAAAATVLTFSALLAPLLVAFIAALSVALVTRQLAFDAHMLGFREGRAEVAAAMLARTDVVTPRLLGTILALALALLVSGAVVFVVFPRTGPPGHFLSDEATESLPREVSLVAAPRASAGRRPLVRVLGPGRALFARGLYLRASAYGAFEHGRFASTPADLSWWPAKGLGPAEPLAYELRWQPGLLTEAASLGPLGEASTFDSEAGYQPLVRGHSPTKGEMEQISRLRVRGSLWPTEADLARPAACTKEPPPTTRELALPAGLDPRIAALAERLTEGATTARSRAQRLRADLQSRATYSLAPSGAGTADPLADFLFGGRRGHCEYFATAFALMLRASGVASRVVGGFAFGAYEPEGQVVLFSGQHAHAWVEWWDPCRGWVMDDATPPQAGEVLGPLGSLAERWRRIWDDQVIGFGATEQRELWGKLAAGLEPLWRPAKRLADIWHWPHFDLLAGGLAVVVVLCAVGILHWARQRAAAATLAAELMGLLRALLGRPVRASESLGSAARACVEAQPEWAKGEQAGRTLAAVAAYERCRFGPSMNNTGEVRRVLREVRRLRRQLRRAVR